MREDMETSLTNLSKNGIECNTMLADKKSASITPEVNLEIHCMQAMKHASEESSLSLRLRADVTRRPK